MPRSRLNKQLDRVLETQIKLVLVLSPVGFGKTTLVSEWANQQNGMVGWFSIEESENQPVLFWQYFFNALHLVIPELQNPFASLKIDQVETKVHNCVVKLINQLAGMGSKHALVLDDFHHIHSPAVLSELAFLLEHLPPTLSLIVISRHEPSWPLARMRAIGSLVEIRTHDLEMNDQEASQLISVIQKADVEEEDLKALNDQIEGWAFGLQLAAVSVLTPEGVESLASRNQLASDYLLEEVFNGLSEEMKQFLLEIAVLDALCSDLCREVTGRQDTEEFIKMLEVKNLFLLPVDNRKEWYRFHRLFLDLLRSRQDHLLQSTLYELHDRASRWFEAHDKITIALDHALRGGNFERAIQLIENNLFKMLDQAEILKQTVLVGSLPEDVLQSRPSLAIADAWLHAYAGDCAKADDCLDMAERSLQKGFGKDNRRTIEGRILGVRAYISWMRGENQKTIKHACQALINLSPDDLLNRSAALISLAAALEESGQLAESLEAYSEAISVSRKVDSVHMYIMACAGKVRLLVNLGKLHQADIFAESAIRQILQQNCSKPECIAALGNIYAHRAEIHRFWNDLDQALELAEEGVRLGQNWGQADTVITTRAVKSAVLWSLTRKQEAMAMHEEIRELAAQISPWYLHYFEAYSILLGILPGPQVQGSKWLDPNVPVELTDYNHHESLLCRAYVRLLFVDHKYEEALKWLDLINEDTLKSGRQMSFADSLVMRAICLMGLEKRDEAVAAFSKAIDIIQSENAIRIILDKGDAPLALLEEMLRRQLYPDLCRELMGLLRQESCDGTFINEDRKSRSVANQRIAGLSAREREVLRFLTTHKTSTEIAQELTVSANTIRFHIKSIYDKLDVHSRGEAVECAKRMHLL